MTDHVVWKEVVVQEKNVDQLEWVEEVEGWGMSKWGSSGTGWRRKAWSVRGGTCGAGGDGGTGCVVDQVVRVEVSV